MTVCVDGAELAAVQADLKRREAERRERLNRAGIAEVQGRCAQWMAVMVVARSAADFHRHVVEGRTRDTNRRATSAAAERVQRRWRFHRAERLAAPRPVRRTYPHVPGARCTLRSTAQRDGPI
jgi:hypothetical protein